MLNDNALDQLRGLKSKMESEKEYAEATVKGTHSRYGFALLDDGREVFIPPDQMLRAFPDDRVRVCIRPGKDERQVAEVHRLLSSPLERFTGRCVSKGKALFVEPDLPRFQRWLFVPPHARNGAREGDYVAAAILRHPIRDGRPQAKVLLRLGDDDTAGIENQYTAAKYGLDGSPPPAVREEVEAAQASAPTDVGRRLDLRDLHFVTIDSARTLDIDDALYAESGSNGWTVHVAIADPTARIGPGSALEAYLEARGTTVYFHGDVLPMLPEALGQDACALAEEQDRPALVCRMHISDSGVIDSFDFFEAMVRSRAKLSYFAVDRYLAGQHDGLMSHATPLEPLYQAYRALRAERERSGLVMEERREFRWILNDQKRIESIEPQEKLQSQRLVEECMIAANRCAAEFLKARGAAGPFVCHTGFRTDRRDELRRFLERHAPELASQDVDSLEGYREVLRALAEPRHALPLRNMVNRLLSRAEFRTEPAPHMGMALPAYTNCTSPLRKYLDFLVHRQIRALLQGREPIALDPQRLQALGERLLKARRAAQEAERWLASRYLARLSTEGEAGAPLWDADICQINSSGFQVRLRGNGLEGFVDLRPDPEKFSFDKWQATLTSKTRRFQLEQPVLVRFLRGDPAQGHLPLFEALPGEGAKAEAPKAEA